MPAGGEAGGDRRVRTTRPARCRRGGRDARLAAGIRPARRAHPARTAGPGALPRDLHRAPGAVRTQRGGEHPRPRLAPREDPPLRRRAARSPNWLERGAIHTTAPGHRRAPRSGPLLLRQLLLRGSCRPRRRARAHGVRHRVRVGRGARQRRRHAVPRREERRPRPPAPRRLRGLGRAMLTKRLIACFDVIGGRVTKAQKFQDNIDVAPAEDLAARLYDDQIDEIVFYDITASAEKRKIDLETVRRVARHVFVPFTVGGGIRSVDDMFEVLKAGAEKISVDSMAVRTPEIIREGADAFGRQCIVLSTQVKLVGARPGIPSGYEVFIDGAREPTGLDALEWVRRGEELGAGEIVVNSIDRDGTASGYDLEITRAVADAVNVPVIASGGAGDVDHIAAGLTDGGAQAAIISSILYSPRFERNLGVRELKSALVEHGVPLRPYLEES